MTHAKIGALLYVIWGSFHVYVAWQIYTLGMADQGLAQGRLYHLAAYMLTLSLLVIAVALTRNWRNDRLGYLLNIAVVSWADIIWVLVVVFPGYVAFARGLIPPAIWDAAAIFTTLGQRSRSIPRTLA